MRTTARLVCAITLFFLFSTPAPAGELLMENDATLSITDASLTMDCNDVTMSGTAAITMNNATMHGVKHIHRQDDAAITMVDSHIRRCIDLMPFRMLILCN